MIDDIVSRKYLRDQWFRLNGEQRWKLRRLYRNKKKQPANARNTRRTDVHTIVNWYLYLKTMEEEY